MPSNVVLSASAFGFGRYKQLTDYNYSTVQGLHGGVGTLFPGAAFAVQGRVFQVVQNRSGGDLAVGDTVSLNVADATRTGNLATGVTVAVLLTDDTHDAEMTGDESNPSWVVVTAGAMATTDDMQLRQVKANVAATTASTLSVALADYSRGPTDGVATSSAEILTGTPDNTWDYSVFVPYEVVKTDLDALATSVMQGVVVSTVITDNYFGVIQLPFGTGLAKVDGTTDLVAGDLLIPSGTAGVLKKHVLTDNNAVTIGAEELNISFVCARVLDAFTDNATGLRHVQFRDTGWTLFPRPIF